MKTKKREIVFIVLQFIFYFGFVLLLHSCSSYSIRSPILDQPTINALENQTVTAVPSSTSKPTITKDLRSTQTALYLSTQSAQETAVFATNVIKATEAEVARQTQLATIISVENADKVKKLYCEYFIESLQDVSISSKDNLFAVGSFRHPDVFVFRYPDGKFIKSLEGHSGGIRTLSFSPFGTKLAAGSYDYTANLWDVRTGNLLFTLRGHRGIVHSVAFSPDGKYLATGSDAGTIRIWNTKDGTLVKYLRVNYMVLAVSFSPDGAYLISGENTNGKIRIWSVQKEFRPITILEAHRYGVVSVDFSPDGRTFASGGIDKTIKIWELETGKLLRTFIGHDQGVLRVTYSNDGKLLVSSANDGTVRLWRVEDGKILNVLEEHNGWVGSVAMNPEETLIISVGGGDGKICYWGL